MKQKEQVGEVECPVKGCTHVVPVYKYGGGDDPARRRFAGRLYSKCPEHGKQEPQEYLLCNAKMYGPEGRKNTTSDDVPQPAVAAPPSSPTTSATSSQKQPASFFDRWSPIIR